MITIKLILMDKQGTTTFALTPFSIKNNYLQYQCASRAAFQKLVRLVFSKIW